MLASYQDVFPTDFLPSVLKRSHASLVSLLDAENKSCLSSAQLALFPLFRVKGADVEPGWGSATGTAAILATVREKVCRKQWRTFKAHCPDIRVVSENMKFWEKPKIQHGSGI